MELLRERPSTSFTSLFSRDTVKAEIIVTFLAVLELVKLGTRLGRDVKPYRLHGGSQNRLSGYT